MNTPPLTGLLWAVTVTAVIGVETIALPAWAGWEYTHWDMGPTEIVDNSDGDVELLETPVRTPGNLLAMAAGRFTSGSVTFDVDFLFKPDPNVLERVILRPAGSSSARELYDAQIALYGQPKKEKVKPIAGGESHTAIWHDAENNNQIRFLDIGDAYLAIEYAPLSRFLSQPTQ